MTDRKLAAVFIDFENFYYSLTNLYGLSYDEANQSAISLIGKQIDELKEKIGEFIIRQAFADWSELAEPKKELQKMGIRVVDVLSNLHKNSADIELSLSVQEVVLTRSDIDVIVIFAGDRDYMPIALRTRERGKLLYLVGFEGSLSGDLKKLVGEGNYSYLVPERDAYKTEGKTISSQPQTQVVLEKNEINLEGLDSDQIKAAIVAIEAWDTYKERFGSVKLSGFLVDRLAKALPNLDHLQRKGVFNKLEEENILWTEVKDSWYGDESFAVFKINEDSKQVIYLREKMAEQANLGKGIT
jgi:uncharacterized LabA/DUF88 family protein